MSKFLTELNVEQIDDISNSGRGLWRLTQPLIYQSDLTGDTYVVPTGATTDFASVPRLPIAFLLCGGTASRPAALHDALYTPDPKTGKHMVPDRETADLVLKEAALSEGVPAWRAWALFLGVRVGGASHWD
jgi:hypothetical protein